MIWKLISQFPISHFNFLIKLQQVSSIKISLIWSFYWLLLVTFTCRILKMANFLRFFARFKLLIEVESIVLDVERLSLVWNAIIRPRGKLWIKYEFCPIFRLNREWMIMKLINISRIRAVKRARGFSYSKLLFPRKSMYLQHSRVSINTFCIGAWKTVKPLWWPALCTTSTLYM